MYHSIIHICHASLITSAAVNMVHTKMHKVHYIYKKNTVI